LWIKAKDPERVAEAANLVVLELSMSPSNVGEQRIGSIRVVIVPPIGMFFRVNSEDRQVLVLTIWSIE